MESPDIETYGRRLLPHIVDMRAKAGYSQPFAMYPKSADAAEGFRSVSYAQIANAVNRVSWWLDAELGEKEDTFVYFGPNDLRYIILVLATIKTGRKILVASPRNTIEAQLALFERTNCKTIVSCSSLSNIMRPLFEAADYVSRVQAPALDDVLAHERVPEYVFIETFDSISDQTFVFLHTSGSSGDPKPISWNITFISVFDSGNRVPQDQGSCTIKACFSYECVLGLLPCFHAGGLAVSFFPMFYEMTLVLVHPDFPLSAPYVAQLLKHGVITTMLTPPSILEDLPKDHSSLQDLAKLKHVGFAGGPLQPDIGNKLAAVLPHLFSFLGATECGWFLNIVGDNRVWDSLKFYSDIGYRFDEVSDGLFELVIDKDEQTNKIFRGIFEVFSTLREYRTKDLYSADPDAPSWYTYRGRADDLIVLSNGEKINPIPLEDIIRSHPLVKGAVVVGEYRFSPSLLVEMENDSIPEAETESHAVLDSIWPTVQEANKITPGFSKIPKSLILFSTTEKPFLRAGKGTIQRQLTVKSYAKELDHMYSSQETGLLIEGLTLADSFSADNVKTFTNDIYSQALGGDDLKDDEDIFLRGMDSLGVSVVVQRLQAALKYCGASLNLSEINPRLVYSAPSVDRTTEALVHLVSTNASLHQYNGNGASRQTKLQSMLEKYSANIQPILENHWSNIPSASPPQHGTEAWNVILTGTTGSLGTHLLATLEAIPAARVAKIFCLNRSSDARERQKKSSQSHGLNFDWDDQRVEFLNVDLSIPNIGLNAEKYDELLRNTTVIIHNAWQVDFNLAIESFEPQIRGLRNLLNFGFHSKSKAPVIFTSSISTAIGWMEQHPDDLVPEAVIHDFDAPQKIGYAESKFVSEHVLETFTRSLGLTTAIFRTGQIAGPLTGKGVWNGREWFPSIMSSSKHLDILPETLGKMESIEWIPVDVLSSIMVELVEEVLRPQSLGKTLVYNLVNPKTVTWSSLLKSAQKVTGISKTVPLKDWVEAVEVSSREKNGAITETNPAVKLLDWLRIISQSQEGTLGFEVRRLVQDSRTASQLTAVTLKWMSLWISRLKL